MTLSVVAEDFLWIFLILFATGCSSKAASPPTNPTQPVTTAAQMLAALENQGKLPGLDTSASLSGLDLNHNGIRDDLDKFVASLPDSASQKQALTQLAKAVQISLTVDLTNAVAVSSTSDAIGRGVACVWSAYPANQHAKVMLVEELSVNTVTRLQAYEKYNSVRSGTTSELPSGSVCG